MANLNVKGIDSENSHIGGMNSKIRAPLIFALSAGAAWIPVIGYFAIFIPLFALLTEKRSNSVRYYLAQALFVSFVRLIFDVVFRSIAYVAKQTVALYGADPDFINFYGVVTNPGHGAFVVGAIFAGIMTFIALGFALFAYYHMPLEIPLVSPLCRAIAGKMPLSKSKCK